MPNPDPLPSLPDSINRWVLRAVRYRADGLVERQFAREEALASLVTDSIVGALRARMLSGDVLTAAGDTLNDALADPSLNASEVMILTLDAALAVALETGGVQDG